MANKRYDVCSPRKGRDKTFWVRVGTAFEGDRGINIVFDALPLPDTEGRVSVSLFEPRDSGGQRGGGGGGFGGRGNSSDDDLGDAVPFMSADASSEWRAR